MIKNIIIGICGVIFGLIAGYVVVQQNPVLNFKNTSNSLTEISESLGLKKNISIGFLPYWLLSYADRDYSSTITTLTYFGLTLDPDGSIQKFTNPGEAEPGWYTLDSGKVDARLELARKKKVNLSLLVFSSNEDTIAAIIDKPEKHAQTMVKEVAPIMKKYGFTDLNIDIESVHDASPEARTKFTAFTREVKKQMNKKNLGTMTIDVSPTGLLRDYLINVEDVSKIADYIVFMTYDYHYSGSFVTGPISPIGGMGKDAELDSETAVKLAKEIMPEDKIILGMPLYGYEWETLETSPRSAVIPGSGQVISNRRVEELLKDCTTCEIKRDENAKEYYVVYEDPDTGTYHQIFYPEKNATQEKINLAEKEHIAGIAAWALGYEGDSILEPLKTYK